MASAYAAPVSATQVGSYFVQQYYQILQQQPDFTHQFYTDSSSVVRGDGESTESASAIVQIHSLIMSLNFLAIEIKTINSLESWNGGVLVVVSGSVKSKNFSGWRKFVQTFFLAPQEKGYFVLNDIFHFVDVEVTNQSPVPGLSEVAHQTPAPVVAESEFDPQPTDSTPLQEQPVSDNDLEVEPREYVNSVHIEEDDPVEGYGFEEHQQEHESVPEKVDETPLEESSGFSQSAEETVEETLPAIEEPVGEAPKLSYASILRAPKGKSVPAVSVQSSFTKSRPEPAVQQASPAIPVVADVTVDVAEERFSHEEGDSKSVYVRNLPHSVSTLELLEEFKSFGRVKQDGVYLQNRKEVGVCYAFVEFEDVQSAQNAVKASPIKLAGRRVYVEMRKPYTGGGRGRGRGGHPGGQTSGRGSYQGGSDSNRVGNNGFRST